MAKNRQVNIKVTSNVSKVLRESGNEGEKAGKKTTGALGKIKGLLGGISSGFTAATGGVRAFTAALLSSGVGAIVVAMGSLVALLSKAVMTSKDFEKALSGLKAITGATNEEMSALSQNARELGRTTAFTASQVVELQTEFSKLGFSTSEILDATEATLALAAASKVDLADAATVAGNTIRAFGFDASETGRVADVMAKSFTSSALDMEKFRESMKLVAPIAKTAKVTFEETSAALSILADRGVSGSIAGTQLRRVMSDLATKTGKDFQTSLEETAKRLDEATTTADKLAIAKELVGDRAKGSLIALAENRDALNDLKLAYEGAGGAAQKMADEQLDNLAGDVTKLSSAWEGFLLGIEDGEGVLNKISRGAVQLLTNTLGFLTKASEGVADAFRVNFASMKRIASTVGERISETFTNVGLNISMFAQKAKMAIADIPIIGKAIDKASLEANLKATEVALEQSNVRLQKLADKASGESVMRAEHYARLKADREQRIEVKAKKKTAQKIEEFVEGASQESQEKEESRAEAFRNRLRKKERDYEAKTREEKVELERQRHLEDLETLELNETEKHELIDRINVLYDSKRKEARAKDKEEQDAKTKAANEAEAEKRAQKRQEIEEDRKAEIQAKMDVLDTAARIAGEETAMGKALLVAKNVLRLKDLVETAKAAAIESGIKAGLSIQEVGKGTAKAIATLNPVVIAGYAVTAAATIATIISTLGKTKKAISKAGGVGVSAPSVSTSAKSVPQTPDINVIGQTSNDANLIASTIGRKNNEPLRAYVVESEISSTQNLARKAENQASIG